jgi:hypothetical protein
VKYESLQKRKEGQVDGDYGYAVIHIVDGLNPGP